MRDYYKIKISPGSISGDIIAQTYSSDTFGVYSAMTFVLSGNAGNSILQDVSVPIFLTQTAIDVGYYSVFDGYVLQKDIVSNFIFSSNTIDPYKYYVFNTSDNKTKKFLDQIDFYIDWGDGTPIQSITNFAPSFLFHNYTSPGSPTITLSALTDWGVSIVTKTITVPFVNVPITNPEGTINFTNLNGNWSGIPTSYDFIFSGDSDCDAQLIRPAGTTPVLITGYSRSNLYDMKKYGGGFKTVGIQFTGATGIVGKYMGQSANGTHTYTINDITYKDFPDGTTIFYVQSSGCTFMDCEYITKDETLMNVIEQPQIFNDVFVERGNNTVLEYMNRIGEVDNIGDITKYGYKFFKFQDF